MKCIKCLFISLFVLMIGMSLIPTNLMAAVIATKDYPSFAWVAQPEATGFRIYWSTTSGTWTKTNSVDVKKPPTQVKDGKTLHYFTLTPTMLPIEENSTMYFVATAYDTISESDYSTIVNYKAPDVVPLPPGALQVVKIEYLTGGGVVITVIPVPAPPAP